MRWSAKGDQRKDPGRLFFAEVGGSPLAIWTEFRWAPVLECVRLAPSASNKQPWRIVCQDGAFHFFLDRDKAYSAMMPLADLQRIDMGIAMCHFQLAAAEAGLRASGEVTEPKLADTPGNYEYIVSFDAEALKSPSTHPQPFSCEEKVRIIHRVPLSS